MSRPILILALLSLSGAAWAVEFPVISFPRSMSGVSTTQISGTASFPSYCTAQIGLNGRLLVVCDPSKKARHDPH